jgi:predicted RNA-binding Zn-ribbon protein involved in translation (DUF1610 family)
MMMKKLEKKNPEYKIDLTAIEGEGSFPCPNCGTIISPEDETERTYKIANTKISNGELAELIMTCTKCRNTIILTGFQQVNS